MQPNLTKAYNLCGKVLVLVSFGFIIYIFWDKRGEIASVDFNASLIAVLLAVSVSYGVSGFLLSTAWYLLLRGLGEKGVSGSWCHGVYGKTQIGKYIPGNIFHFAGRHITAKGAGLSHLVIVGSTVYEILLLLTSSSTLALVGLLLMRVKVQGASSIFIGILLALILSITLAASTLIPYVALKRGIDLPQKGIKDHIRALSPCFVLYISFFLITGSILGVLVCVIANVPIDMGLFGNIVIIYACSWIVGYVTPGAPGGVGVREAIIVFSLMGTIGEVQSMLVAMLFRFTTVSGDIIFYLLTQGFSPADTDRRRTSS